MIIEAGYDLMTLLEPEVLKDNQSKQALWALGMDQHLRYMLLSKACDIMTGSPEEHINEIAEVLNCDFATIKCYALAHTAPETRADSNEWLHDVDERLRVTPALSNYCLLGRAVFNPDGYSSIPRYRFHDYPGLSELPKTATIARRHNVDCDCFAYDQHERILAADWPST